MTSQLSHDSGSLAERYLPQWHWRSEHFTLVKAPPASVFKAIKRLDLGRSPLVAALFRLRGLPASSLTFPGLLRIGFIVLGERQDREILLGIAGKFWTPHGALHRLAPEEFRTFATPGTARAVWGFRIEATGSETQLSTETRIACADRRSRNLFRWYWMAVGPFSGLVRRRALRLIRQDAEADRRSD